MKFLLLFLLCASPALARIGETPEQCEARYGKPARQLVQKEDVTVWYEKAGYEIMCVFFEGRCDMVDFSKLEKSASGRPLPLTASEVKVLLESNTAGKAWVQTGSNAQKGYSAWKCDDLEALSIERDKDCYLSISTRMHDLRMEKSTQSDEELNARKRLEGF